MSNEWALVFALVAGVGLAIFFYAGLYITLRYSLLSKHSALWISASFLLRMAITMAGFYLIANGDWQRAIACLASFIVAGKLVQLSALKTQAVDKKLNNSQSAKHGA